MNLISREALVAVLQKYKFGAITNETEREYTKDIILDFVADQPTIDAVPVVRGEWSPAFTEEENVWKCSNCDDYWLLNNGTPFDNGMKFCPKCGADMRKGGAE